MSEALPIGRLGTAVLPSTPDEEVKTAERVQDCDKEAQTSKLHSSDDNKDQDDEPLQLYVAQGEQVSHSMVTLAVLKAWCVTDGSTAALETAILWLGGHFVCVHGKHGYLGQLHVFRESKPG